MAGKKSLIYDVLILGGGASGLMLASFLKGKYLVIEHNKNIGEKIKISGGGRCNFTNEYISYKNYVGDKNLINRTFAEFDNRDLIKFFKNNGLKYEKIKNNQYFCKNSAKDVLDIFRKVNVALGYEILDVKKDGEIFLVITDKGIFKSKKVVVATGGLSYKSVGATGIGYQIAEKFGHTIVKLKPALVGFTLQPPQSWFKKLSGISIFSNVRVEDRNFKDNILFAHKGISGPAILNASLYWEKGEISINFLPNFKVQNSNKFISTFLNLPKRFTLEFLNSNGFVDKPIKNSKNEIKLLQNYSFAPAGNFGYTKAEVTKGGVNTDEINGNFESKLVKDLYFIGEILDVTGELGGYNFQWAFSSAFVCAKNINGTKGGTRTRTTEVNGF